MKKIILISILLISIHSFAQVVDVIWDTITFEEPYTYLEIDTASQNLWQIGEPNKVFFSSAYSIPNAIVTDTINFYPINNNSSFDIKIGAFNYYWYFPFSICLEIKHKVDTDTLKDGGYISVSYDEGLTWINIIQDTSDFWDATPFNDFNCTNLYTDNDTLYNGEFGFSGLSNYWITTTFGWAVFPVKNVLEFPGDTMIVRFNFVSDTSENSKEGWMIDNIKLYSIDLGGSINEQSFLNFQIKPNPLNECARVEIGYYREVQLSIYTVEGKLVKKRKYYNNQDITIKRDNLKTGIYFIVLRTDENLFGIRKLIIN